MSFPSERGLGNRFAFWRQNIVLNDGSQRRDLQGLCFFSHLNFRHANRFLCLGQPRFPSIKGENLLVCQTYVTPYLMKSWSVSFGDFHPSGRIGKQL